MRTTQLRYVWRTCCRWITLLQHNLFRAMSFFYGKRTPAPAEAPLAPVQKLREFHQLTKEALERAYTADVSGQAARALELYRLGLESAEEGLKLTVATSGLGPKADNAAAWKEELKNWKELAADRIRVLESGSASTSAPRITQARTRQPMAAGTGSRSVVISRTQQPSRAAGTSRSVSLPLPRAGAAGTAAAKGAKDELSKYRDIILGEVLDNKPSVSWDQIADLKTAKQALMEAVILPSLRADIFQGLRAPTRGILLYGPPGNGKTMLAKALAHEAKSTFFNISASSLTSKWVGEGEKLVRALFQLASEMQPSIIFMDEVDSMLSARSSNEHDAMRRLKTEFLVQFDGVASGDDRIVVLAATNRPQELDEAVRRRLVKRIYIPLPDSEARRTILKHLLKGQGAALSGREVESVVSATDMYSASDLTALCKEAAMGPIRELGSAIANITKDRIRAINAQDFQRAMQVIKPSVNKDGLKLFEQFTKEFGTV